MGNLSGVVAVLSVLLRPSLVVPHIQVDDINQLDWQALYDNGVRFLVFDKDNCLTKPHVDRLEDAIADSWKRCQRVFGRDNILMVSNSSGSSSDSSGLGAETLSRALGVPVLCHAQKKPSSRCAAEALNYFAALSSEPDVREQVLRAARVMPPGSTRADSSVVTTKALKHLAKAFRKKVPQDTEGQGSILLVGDRTMTDVVLAHRMNDNLIRRRKKHGLLNSPSTSVPAPQCISVLTTQIWANEGRVNTWLRRLEAHITSSLIERGYRPGQAAFYRRSKDNGSHVDWQRLGTYQPSLGTKISAEHLALNADKDSTREFPATGQTKPSPPDSTLSNTAVGAMLVNTITKPLPPLLGRFLATVLRSKPVAWTASNFHMGWKVMILGIASGMQQAGLAPHRRSKSLPSPYIILDETVPARAPANSTATITQMLDSKIPQINAESIERMRALGGQLGNRLNATASSARQLVARRMPSMQSVTSASVPAKTQALLPNPASQTSRQAFHTSARFANQHSQHQQNPAAAQPGKPFRPSARSWALAFTALFITPVCYYGGMRLSRYRNQRKIDKQIDFSEQLPPTPATPSPGHPFVAEQLHASFETSARDTLGVSEAERKALLDRKLDLQRTLFHLVHDRTDVSEKLKQIHARMDTKAKANP